MSKYVLIVVALVLYKLHSTPQPLASPVHPQQVAPAGTGQPSGFAMALARRLGNPAPDAATLRFIDSWIQAEGTAAAYNPLATSQDMPGATVFNSHGVKNYLNAEQGIDATVITLHYGYPGYEAIRLGIQTNDPQRALRGLAASPWGTSAALVRDVYNQSRQAVGQPVAYVPTADDAPTGNPLNDPRTRLSQGYGVGTHAPAATWGAIDLVLDTPAATTGAPVFATTSGIARVTESWPCGLGVALTNDRYRVLYCHLSSAAVEDGQQVQRGQHIGAVGSSGHSTGAHLHYEIWKDGVNVNPLDYATR